MIPWPIPQLPTVAGESVPLRLFDTRTGQKKPAAPGPTAGMYVCGITPYDATHMGHAATYVAFDLLNRVWRDNGREVTYVQNITDVDDPLLERALVTGDHWTDLAAREIALFGEDMTALGVIPPDVYLGAVETVPLVVESVRQLEGLGAAYRVPVENDEATTAGACDIYFDVSADPHFGTVSGFDRDTMLALFAERGGDPDRPGKEDPLDPLLWRAERPGEPAWDGGGLGRGRPGWHIECVSIALRHLDHPFDVNAGGLDLVVPHHEMGASHAHLLAGAPYAHTYAHAGMVGLDGHKMSKSRGNLVKVSVLRAQGVDPMAVRLVLLAHHYRGEWEWTDAKLADAQARLELWRTAMSMDGCPPAGSTVAAVRERMADDLDAPGALAAVDAWVDKALSEGGDDTTAAGVLSRAVNAILGVRF